ncbi:MAG: hypothetical protein KDK78_10285, partial [Chlamydiia bacterium]|nr:hypothetical protein [Chlamydiia bacterium]
TIDWENVQSIDAIVRSVGKRALALQAVDYTDEKTRRYIEVLEAAASADPQLEEEQIATLRANIWGVAKLLSDCTYVGVHVDRARVDRLLDSDGSSTLTQRTIQHLLADYGPDYLSKGMVYWTAFDTHAALNGDELCVEDLYELERRTDSVRQYKAKTSSSDAHLDSAYRMFERMAERTYTEAGERLLDYYMVAAVKLAYARLASKESKLRCDSRGRFPEDARPVVPTADGLPDYRLFQEVRNTHRLKVVALVPEEPGHPPIILCRGTAKDRNGVPYSGNLRDDAHHDIGLLSVEMSEAVLEDMICEVSKRYGPALVLGHSLGGAVGAQLVALHGGKRIPEGEFEGQWMLREFLHFGAPAPGDTARERFARVLEHRNGEHRLPMRAFFHRKDQVWYYGGDYLEGTELHLFGEKQKIRNVVVAHSKPDLLSEYKEREDVRVLGFGFDEELQKLRARYQGVADKLRSMFGTYVHEGLGALAEKKQRQVETAKLLREMAE